MSKYLCKIDKNVVSDVDFILELAKKGRKKLKPNEISELRSIDANEFWSLLQKYSLETKTKQVPVDILRMIMMYLDAKDYRKSCITLNKKFNNWATQDTLKLRFRIHTTRFSRNGCSGCSYYYYACVYTKDLPTQVTIDCENEEIKRGMCHHTEFTRKYHADFIIDASNISSNLERYNDNTYQSCGSLKKVIKRDGIDLQTYWVNKSGRIKDKDSASQSSHLKYVVVDIQK